MRKIASKNSLSCKRLTLLRRKLCLRDEKETLKEKYYLKLLTAVEKSHPSPKGSSQRLALSLITGAASAGNLFLSDVKKLFLSSTVHADCG